jgi:UDP-N-acetylmuramoyl-tripeptide--D-alanyl-D-alanine ligase
MSTMMPLSLACSWLTGAKLVGDGNTPVLRVHSDTRTIELGDLFVALKGERYDANDFLADAHERGAAAVLCHASSANDHYPQGLARIEVPDTRIALAELARGWRSQFRLPLIAVTGSNGKTTVTQMIASILEAFAPNGASLATSGNLNNDIGVPLTLLRLRPEHCIAVVELGMNHPGEIAALADIARPTVALVNNAQREHLEFMQTVEAVARENASVFAALPQDGIAVFPANDAFTPLWEQLAGGRQTARFSHVATGSVADTVCIEASWREGAWQVQARSGNQQMEFGLHIAGRHNVTNGLAAATCALAAGVSVDAIQVGLERFVPVKGRSRALAIDWAGHAITVVDDTYNANPDSVRAAIDVLAELPSPGLLVLGDMGEVGENGPQFHAEAGRYASTRGIQNFYALGALAAAAAAEFSGARHFESMEALQAAVLLALPEANSVLVKGSRFMRMERVVEAITNAGAKSAPSNHANEGVTPCC